MKRKIGIGVLILLCLGIGVFTYNKLQNHKYVFTNTQVLDKLKSGSLSMMLETEVNSGTYQQSKEVAWPSEGYVFNESLSKCENGGELSWDDSNKKVVLESNKSDKCYVYFDVEVPVSLETVCTAGEYLQSCVKNFASNGTEKTNIYIHDSSLTNGAKDNSYRYAGASEEVNNFVCFGSDATTCPTDNLYRMIGVFGRQVKLVKYDYATSSVLGTNGDYYTTASMGYSSTYKGVLTQRSTYYWNYKNNTSTNSGNGSNTWSTSLLNKTNLNTNYLNNIGSIWSNMIENTIWKVGGNTQANIRKVVPGTSYQNEIMSPAASTTYSAKIGLLYFSDYGFAAAPSAWSTTLSNYDSSSVKLVNWMFMGAPEFLITPLTDNLYAVGEIDSAGHIFSATGSSMSLVRPVFSLKAEVMYNGGNGTISSPVRLSI